MEEEHQVVVPWQELGADALARLVSDFVTRDGTDYGVNETALEAKSQAVMEQLRKGTACIVFDGETQSCNIVPVDSLPGAHIRRRM